MTVLLEILLYSFESNVGTVSKTVVSLYIVIECCYLTVHEGIYFNATVSKTFNIINLKKTFIVKTFISGVFSMWRNMSALSVAFCVQVCTNMAVHVLVCGVFVMCQTTRISLNSC